MEMLNQIVVQSIGRQSINLDCSGGFNAVKKNFRNLRKTRGVMAYFRGGQTHIGFKYS